MTTLAILQWRPQLDPLLGGLLIIGIGAWLYWTYRRLRVRFAPAKAWLLLAPKLIVALLLVLALFEPVWGVERQQAQKGKLLTVVDTSSSMDVVDDGKESRLTRARRILGNIKDELPGGVTLETLEFDTQVRKPGEAKKSDAVRGTDLGGCLATLAERADISSYLGVVLVTDGGDEPLTSPAVPPVPLSVIGIGAAPSQWRDLAIAELEAPATVEKDGKFEVTVDLVARGLSGTGVSPVGDSATHGRDARATNAVGVKLERDGKEIAKQAVDLSRNRVRTKFSVTAEATGLQRYRVVLDQMPGEISYLNNVRNFTVDVQKKSLHVLYFTRELGADFKMLRSEIGRDPGIAFTALFRTLSERFTVQGERLAGDEELDAGFPTSLKTLQLFDCVIIGSFPAVDWRPEQFEALVKYVEAGGAVVFLGGEKSFGLGGYAATPVAPLYPWQLNASEPELARGEFTVSVPAAGAGNPIIAGLEETLAQQGAVVSSANLPGMLKPGATPLLAVNVGERSVALAAVQSFGKGKVLGVASNTIWEWARKTEVMRGAYATFWRQAVRNLTGKVEGGRVLSVRWDKEFYRPGDLAVMEIRCAELRLTAAVTMNNETKPLAVEPVKGRAGESAVQWRFKERGEYVFRLVAYQGENVLESYEKTQPVAPLLAEGSRLELDEEGLKKLAEKGGGMFLRESEAGQLAKNLAARLWQKTTLSEMPLAQAGPWFVLIVLGLLASEWWMRRKMNLI